MLFARSNRPLSIVCESINLHVSKTCFSLVPTFIVHREQMDGISKRLAKHISSLFNRIGQECAARMCLYSCHKRYDMGVEI